MIDHSVFAGNRHKQRYRIKNISIDRNFPFTVSFPFVTFFGWPKKVTPARTYRSVRAGDATDDLQDSKCWNQKLKTINDKLISWEEYLK